MIRFGIVGAGMIFERYEQAAARIADVDIVAVADPNHQRLAAAGSGGRKLFSDVDALLGSEIDAVIILSPNHSHASLVEQCLEQGVAVLCEKPLSTTVESASRLVELAASRGILLDVAMHCRYRPEIRYLRKHMRGEIHSFAINYLEDWSTAPGWYYDPELSGGGVLLDVGINQMDWILPFLEGVEPREINIERENKGVETSCAVWWRHSGGAGETTLSWRAKSEQKHSRIVTTSGEVFVLDHRCHSIMHNGRGQGPWRNEDYEGVLRNFILALRSGSPSCTPGMLNAMRLLRSAYEMADLPFLSETAARE